MEGKLGIYKKENRYKVCISHGRINDPEVFKEIDFKIFSYLYSLLKMGEFSRTANLAQNSKGNKCFDSLP